LDERQGSAARIAIVIRLAAKNVQVGATEPDGFDPHANLVVAQIGTWHVAHLETPDVRQQRGAHQRSLHTGPSGNPYAARLSGFIVMLCPGARGGIYRPPRTTTGSTKCSCRCSTYSTMRSSSDALTQM